ncbi:MAG: MurT ligase domain-containing protein [Eubacteriales bacterium]|nr:MurT ligase domain-containing protein [Eubacteriales bacterium]
MPQRKPLLIQTILAVAACKATRGALRLARRGGTALPGKAAMLFARNVLETTSAGMEIVVVTGTNGKTTTSRMIENAFVRSGRKCLANKSGANLLSGVTAEITANATWLGKPKTRYAVIECDEGALKQVVPLIRPKVIVVTNLFRDQLDRYGEVMHTLDAIRTGIRLTPESVLCLNADCSLTASLAQDVPNPVTYYGLDVATGDQSERTVSDARHCIRCGAVYRYHYHTYAHLGGFYCPDCGYCRPEPEVAVTQIVRMSPQGSTVRMALTESAGQMAAREETGADTKPAVREIESVIGLPAVYNIYNAAASMAACRVFGLAEGDILGALREVHSCFGRMETFDLNGVAVQMILVKNPAGCNQALAYLAELEEPFTAVFCLNDRTADGHDISWIWDADYEQICEKDGLARIYVAGDRAEDMQLRLKYAGAQQEQICMEKDYSKLVARMRESSTPVFILPNYTSMLALRQVLGEACGKKEFWRG